MSFACIVERRYYLCTIKGRFLVIYPITVPNFFIVNKTVSGKKAPGNKASRKKSFSENIVDDYPVFFLTRVFSFGHVSNLKLDNGSIEYSFSK